MKITTMNVNGIRAAFRKGLDTWLENHDADLLCLQEVRASAEDACALLGPAWDTRVWECRIKGRAGVALALRRDSGFSWGEAVCGLGESAYGGGEEPAVDTGRWLESAVRTVGGRQLRLVSAYLHSGSLDTPKQAEKMAYLQRIQHRVMDLGAAARTNPPRYARGPSGRGPGVRRLQHCAHRYRHQELEIQPQQDLRSDGRGNRLPGCLDE